MENKYNTKQRDIILSYLESNKDKHITCEDLLFYFKSNNINIGKSTIYRYFEVLINENKLVKFKAIDNKSSCYRYTNEGDIHNHYHLICDDCNELFHLECKHLDGINSHLINNHNFSLNNANTIFHGVCDKCKED